MNNKFWRKAGTILTYAILILATAWALFPSLWVVSTSFKIPKQYFSRPPVWIPTNPTLDHYVTLFTKIGGAPYYKNSVIIAAGNTILTLILSIPTAYAISRHRVGGERFSFWLLSQRMLPPIAAVIPLFLLYIRLGLLDTHLGIILAYCIFSIPFAVWILMGFFDDFPQEIQEQALVDGCSELQSLWKIVIPLISPGIVVVTLFCFIFAWNELMFVLAFSRTDTRTVMKLFESLLQSPTSYMFGPAAASVVLGIIPSFILTMFFQRYLVRGLTMGGIRG